ncbi:MAG: single-stranded DNA-binding protein [candidate division Zixibacteria bacterium]|nr:single-stranded DNA-binding protein [candidate division Zixibacteria bacterium]
MASVNLAILIGNLGRDPELRYTPGGQAVTSFSIATTEKWKDKSGELTEKTEWHNIVCWGRNAEIASQYLKKGSPVYLEGRIQNRSYDDKDGNRRYISEVVVRRLQLLSGGARRDDSEAGMPPPPGDQDSMAETDDDLPF